MLILTKQALIINNNVLHVRLCMWNYLYATYLFYLIHCGNASVECASLFRLHGKWATLQLANQGRSVQHVAHKQPKYYDLPQHLQAIHFHVFVMLL